MASASPKLIPFNLSIAARLARSQINIARLSIPVSSSSFIQRLSEHELAPPEESLIGQLKALGLSSTANMSMLERIVNRNP